MLTLVALWLSLCTFSTSTSNCPTLVCLSQEKCLSMGAARDVLSPSPMELLVVGEIYLPHWGSSLNRQINYYQLLASQWVRPEQQKQNSLFDKLHTLSKSKHFIRRWFETIHVFSMRNTALCHSLICSPGWNIESNGHLLLVFPPFTCVPLNPPNFKNR